VLCAQHCVTNILLPSQEGWLPLDYQLAPEAKHLAVVTFVTFFETTYTATCHDVLEEAGVGDCAQRRNGVQCF